MGKEEKEYQKKVNHVTDVTEKVFKLCTESKVKMEPAVVLRIAGKDVCMKISDLFPHGVPRIIFSPSE